MTQVSVVVPTYNHAHYLSKAIDSVLAQTFAHWEAIIVDDGSTDNTGEVVDRYQDARIRYIYQENQGLAAARNTAIRAARGEYLAFLDADDTWAPRFLERSLAVLTANAALAGTFTGHYFIDHDGARLPRVVRQEDSSTGFRERLLRGGFFPPCTVLTHSELVRNVGMFDTELAGHGTEDWDLWWRISAHRPMQGISDPLAHYRVYPGSMSTNAKSMHMCRLSVLTKHFGPPEGEPQEWASEKRRAYGFAHRSTARRCLQQGQLNKAWSHLEKGARIWPPLLERLDTFYELACGDQPKGYRGDAARLDIEANGTQMFGWLDELFQNADEAVEATRGGAYGNAYLALAMLSDQAGRWAQARAYLLRAIRSYPALLRDPKVVRRLLKLCAGQRVIGWLRNQNPLSAEQQEVES